MIIKKIMNLSVFFVWEFGLVVEMILCFMVLRKVVLSFMFFYVVENDLKLLVMEFLMKIVVFLCNWFNEIFSDLFVVEFWKKVCILC